MTPLGLDTSVAVPLLVQTHSSHADVVRWLGRRPAALSGHACAETYSVLTRLPGDARLTPVDAARLLVERLASPMLLAAATAERLPALLAEAGVEGGAVYDALSAAGGAGAGAPRLQRWASVGPQRRHRRGYDQAQACRPHSTLSSTWAQRPERGSSPGATRRVQGAQPMEG